MPAKGRAHVTATVADQLVPSNPIAQTAARCGGLSATKTGRGLPSIKALSSDPTLRNTSVANAGALRSPRLWLASIDKVTLFARPSLSRVNRLPAAIEWLAGSRAPAPRYQVERIGYPPDQNFARTPIEKRRSDKA